MCLVREWNFGLLHKAIAPWLSSCITVGCSYVKFISFSNERSHSASCNAKLAAIYSASVDDRATIGCFLLVQLINPPHRKYA